MEHIEKPEQDSIGTENVNSFDGLYELIRAKENIQGTQKDYTPEQLIKIHDREKSQRSLSHKK